MEGWSIPQRDPISVPLNTSYHKEQQYILYILFTRGGVGEKLGLLMVPELLKTGVHYKKRIKFHNVIVGWVAKWLAHSTFKRDIVGSNPAWVETIFRPLLRLAHTRRALG